MQTYLPINKKEKKKTNVIEGRISCSIAYHKSTAEDTFVLRFSI